MKFCCTVPNCEKTFSTQTSLSNHQKVHTGEKPFECDTCGKGFLKKAHMDKHRYVHDNSPFTCGVCSKSFGAMYNLNLHMRSHTGERPFKCDLCESSFMDKSGLTKHMRIHTGEKPYPCEVCGRFFRERKTLTDHMRTHTGERPYKCDLCDASFRRRNYLNNHIRRHEGDRPFMCTTCGRGFTDESLLEEHSKVHSGQRPHRCEFCEKSFTQRTHLNKHIRMHHRVKIYACPMCDDILDTKAELVQHKGEKHNQEAPWICSVCSKAFKRHGALNKHMRIHTGERRYVCETCGMAFIQSSHLTQHRRIHSGERPYSCELCGKAFAQNSTFRSHMRVHMNETPQLLQLDMFASFRKNKGANLNSNNAGTVQCKSETSPEKLGTAVPALESVANENTDEPMNFNVGSSSDMKTNTDDGNQTPSEGNDSESDIQFRYIFIDKMAPSQATDKSRPGTSTGVEDDVNSDQKTNAISFNEKTNFSLLKNFKSLNRPGESSIVSSETIASILNSMQTTVGSKNKNNLHEKSTGNAFVSNSNDINTLVDHENVDTENNV